MNEEKKVPFKWEYGEETISLQLGMYANNQRLYIGMITHNEQIISGYDNSGIVTVLSVIAMCFMGPLVEEILFRYIYQNWLVSKMKMCNGIIAIVIVSISFGMIHSGLSVLELSYYSILGLILGLIYDHTDSITMVIMIHMINNTVGMLTD